MGKTVYILGAGFSAAANYPVMETFYTKMRDAEKWLASNGKSRESAACKAVLDFRQKMRGVSDDIQINLENIEELFSLALANPAYGSLDSDVVLAIAGTLFYCESTCNQSTLTLRFDPAKIENPQVRKFRAWKALDETEMRYAVPIYDFAVGVMAGLFLRRDEDVRTTIITFNYDCLIEQSLRRLNIDYTYDEGNETLIQFENLQRVRPLQLLKLHGSINWAHRENGFEYSESYSEIAAKGQVPALIPPTWGKAFSKALKEKWSLAIRALSEASTIVIVGFSVPATDAHFKYTLGTALNESNQLENIFFVNNNKEAIGQFSQLLKPGHRKLVELEPMKAMSFFLDANTHLRPFSDYLSIVMGG